MSLSVIDTNIVLIANKQSHATEACELRALQVLRSTGRLGLDTVGLILAEYRKKLDVTKPHLPGAAFLVALFNHQVQPVHIDIALDDNGEFKVFPKDPSLVGFDDDDRKFVAVALAAGAHVLHVGLDSDFDNFESPLRKNGVNLDFVCR